MKNLSITPTSEEFTTSDILLISTFLYFQIKPIKILPDSTNRFHFTFRNSLELRKIKLDFLNDELKVSPRHFFNILRNIKSILKVQRSDNG